MNTISTTDTPLAVSLLTVGFAPAPDGFVEKTFSSGGKELTIYQIAKHREDGREAKEFVAAYAAHTDEDRIRPDVALDRLVEDIRERAPDLAARLDEAIPLALMEWFRMWAMNRKAVMDAHRDAPAQIHIPTGPKSFLLIGRDRWERMSDAEKAAMIA